MKRDFLLNSAGARRLYEYARELPIIDYHNHLSMSDIALDRRFNNLTELWLDSDPYKHRLMRICGVEERYITGNAEPFEKFERFCGIFPLLAGNPVFDWSQMELSRVFGIEELLTKERARYIYDKAGERLMSPEYSNNGILKQFSIEYQSPVATLLDDLSGFDGKNVAPSLRGDNLLDPSPELRAALKRRTGKEDYLEGVCCVLDDFHSAGCRFADHALDAGFFSNHPHTVELLCRLGTEYAKRGWTLLLHVDAKRDTSSRLAHLAGPAGGYAAAGGSMDLAALCELLNVMEQRGGLPDTVIFPLNMNDQAPISILQGSFAQDGVASKVQLGPAWWWCDHALGIRNTLDCIASFGVVSQFIGMTTDSRSVLSFVRHDYFRRLLCGWMDEHDSQWALPLSEQEHMLRRMCYENALDKIKKGDHSYGTEI